MLVVISPAKKLDWSPVATAPTTPRFEDEAADLAAYARDLTHGQLKALMKLSDDLAALNRDRFRAFAPRATPGNSKPAIHAFAGDTYQGLDAGSLSAEALDYAQSHLRILSGLYGVLRPRDAIQPYRLEMGSRLRTHAGGNLYAYWGDRIATALNESAAEVGATALVNCASQEYFGAVDQAALDLPVVTPQFYEVKAGMPKMISFHAKRARGAMARFIVENRVTTPDALADFDADGYVFQQDQGDATRMVFWRDAEVLRATG